jgi:hypothetical protein
VSTASLQGAAPRVMPVRPLPGEQPAKGFSWEDYEGVQVSEDASDEEEGGWGVVRSRRSRFHFLSHDILKFLSELHSQKRTRPRLPRKEEQQPLPRPRRSHSR